MEPTALKPNALMLVITLLLVLSQTALYPTAQKVALEVTAIHKLLTTLLVHQLFQLLEYNIFAQMSTVCVAHLETAALV
jgi:hypothetical protein